MTQSNYVLDLFYYTKELITGAWEWQYKGVSGKGAKPKLFFTRFQVLSLCISVAYLFLTIDKVAFNKDFINYMITSFSIFVGLFVSILIMFFDKLSSLKAPGNNVNELIIYRHSRNFFYQFTYLTTYNIFIAILLLVLLIIPLLFDGFNLPLKTTWLFVKSNSIFDLRTSLKILKATAYSLHKVCTLYFILDFFFIAIFSISSITKFTITNFERNNPNL